MVFPLHLIVEFAQTKSAEMQTAFEEFFGDRLPLTIEDVENEKIMGLFSEWLVFDFQPSTDIPFIEEYVKKNPDRLKEEILDAFRQIARTHQCAHLQVKKVKRGEWLQTEDVFTGKTYRIYDVEGSKNIPGSGVFNGRIARVNRRWHLVGANPIFMPIVYTERMKKTMLRPAAGEIDISPKDTAALLWARDDAPPPEPAEMPSRREMERKRERLRAKFEKIAKRYKVVITFDELTEAIYKERKTKNILDFWKRLTKKGLDEDLLVNEHKLFQDIWNYFPHKCLNDLSPHEMYIKHYGTRSE